MVEKEQLSHEEKNKSEENDLTQRLEITERELCKKRFEALKLIERILVKTGATGEPTLNIQQIPLENNLSDSEVREIKTKIQDYLLAEYCFEELLDKYSRLEAFSIERHRAIFLKYREQRREEIKDDERFMDLVLKKIAS